MTHFGTAICLSFCLIFSFGGLTAVSGQDRENDFYIKEGKLLFEQKTNGTLGEIDFTGYRLEVIDPPYEMSGDSPTPRVFRIVVVSSQPLPKMELYSVWFGDLNELDAYLTRPNEFTALIFAKTLPSGEISIGVSRRGKQRPDDRLVFPGTLYVPPEYATPTDELETEPVIKLIRLSTGRIQIRVEYERGGCFDLATALPRYSFLEIEGFDHDSLGPSPFTCSGRNFVGTFSPEEFARIPNGANIVKKVVIGENVSRKVVGRLYKSPIE